MNSIKKTLFVLVTINICLIQAAYVDIVNFQQQMTTAINSIRELHGTKTLKFNAALSNTAQLYATKLAFMDSGISKDYDDLISCGILIQSIEGSDVKDNSRLLCGESLALSATYDNIADNCNPTYIAQLWNSERLNYNYNSTANNFMPPQETLDFTQLIW